MTTLKLRKVGNAVGVILPRALLDRLKVQDGDELHVVETPDGLELTPYDPEFERQMKSADRVLRRYRNTLRELAK
jgi:putative addiction module antidote